MASLTWLITGCSSGFGFSLAYRALQAGHHVVASSRNPSKTPELVQQIEKAGGKWVALDVTFSPEQLQKIVNEYQIDVLVNNAGYSVLGAVEDISDAQAHSQMETNFFGPLKLTQAVLPGMRERRKGTIVNISSIAGLDGLPTCGLYAASKFALEGLSESLSREVASFGIRVLLVEPGAFRTAFLTGNSSDFIESSAPYTVKGSPVAEVMEKFKEWDGKQPGDVEKGVLRMYEAITGDGMAGNIMAQKSGGFARLLLGPDCLTRARDKVRALHENVEAMAEIANSTNVDD